MVSRIVLVMVIVVVMVGGLFAERVEAQSEDCSSMVDNLGQVPAQLTGMSYSDALDAYACASQIVPVGVGRTYHLEFQGSAGQIANIRVTGVNPDELDPLVQLISPSGRLLDFGNDVDDVSRDIVLSGIEILEDGTYTFVLSYAPGSGEANIAVSLEQHWRRGPGIR